MDDNNKLNTEPSREGLIRKKLILEIAELEQRLYNECDQVKFRRKDLKNMRDMSDMEYFSSQTENTYLNLQAKLSSLSNEEETEKQRLIHKLQKSENRKQLKLNEEAECEKKQHEQNVKFDNIRQQYDEQLQQASAELKFIYEDNELLGKSLENDKSLYESGCSLIKEAEHEYARLKQEAKCKSQELEEFVELNRTKEHNLKQQIEIDSNTHNNFTYEIEKLKQENQSLMQELQSNEKNNDALMTITLMDKEKELSNLKDSITHLEICYNQTKVEINESEKQFYDEQNIKLHKFHSIQTIIAEEEQHTEKLNQEILLVNLKRDEHLTETNKLNSKVSQLTDIQETLNNKINGQEEKIKSLSDKVERNTKSIMDTQLKTALLDNETTKTNNRLLSELNQDETEISTSERLVEDVRNEIKNEKFILDEQHRRDLRAFDDEVKVVREKLHEIDYQIDQVNLKETEVRKLNQECGELSAEINEKENFLNERKRKARRNLEVSETQSRKINIQQLAQQRTQVNEQRKRKSFGKY